MKHRANLKANPTPRPPPRSIREGERTESRWFFVFSLVLICAVILNFIIESPFPNASGYFPCEAGDRGGARVGMA